jgi:hypothetical protein
MENGTKKTRTADAWTAQNTIKDMVVSDKAAGA